jgi:Protein of unknown function (DUF3575)
MKKWLFLALLAFQFSNAQDGATILASKQNEVKLDVLSAIAFSKIHVSYERFLNKDFSIGISGGIQDSKNDKEDFDKGYDRSLPKYEVNPFVRYSLSKSQKSFYFAEVFVSANGGEYRELQRFVDESGNGYYDTFKGNYTDVALGGALGYKLYIQEKFGLELFFGIGKNLFNTDKSPETIPHVGLNFGYRF